MPDRWSEERERRWRERYGRSEAYGRGREDDRPGRAWGEDRSFGGPPDDDMGPRGSRFEGPGRDRVFGERDTGAEYNRRGQPSPGGGAYGAGGTYGGGEGYGPDTSPFATGRGAAGHGPGEGGGQAGRGGYGGEYRGYGRGQSDWRAQGWQDRDYQGVSPAMDQDEYEAERRARQAGPRFQSQDYTRGGRFYGDDGRTPIYRQEWGQGGVEYGQAPRGYDAERGRGGYGREERRFEGGYGRERPYSGGTGGYDYEVGYGDAGREQSAGPSRWDQRPRFEDRGRGGEGAGFEGHARAAGEFLHRAGERLSSWLGGMGGERRGEDRDEGGPRRYSADFGREARWVEDRGHRGRGPKGYQRPDHRISDEAHQRLTDDPWLDASQIEVRVENGEVTLTGAVENREAKHRAERLVEEISGVSHVQNNLRVGGNFFTSPTSGFGDSAVEAQMRGEGQAGDGSASTRSTTRRT